MKTLLGEVCGRGVGWAEVCDSLPSESRCGYGRRLVHAEPRFSILVNMWEEAQATPIHRHTLAKGAWSARKVLSGRLLYESFGVGDPVASVTPQTSEVLEAGAVRGFAERGELHRVTALARSISLHVYAPLYLDMCFQEGGSECVLPCDVAPKRDLHITTIFPDLQSLVRILDRELKDLIPGQFHSDDHIEAMLALLDAVRISPAEWKLYTRFEAGRYTRNLVARTDKFALLILCWEKGMESPIHDHSGSSCFVKILEGGLREKLFESPPPDAEGQPAAGPAPLALKSDRVLTAGQVTYINDKMGLHSMGSANDERCITMHIYCPPYSTTRIFDLATGVPTTVPVTLVHPLMVGQAPTANTGAALPGFLAKLTAAFSQPDTPERRQGIIDIIDSTRFGAEELRKYVSYNEFRYSRTLLGCAEGKFSCYLLCWHTGQASPVHSHDPALTCWVKVLAGVLAITRYPGGDPANEDDAKVTLLNSASKARCLDNTLGLHKAENPSADTPLLSLHIYSGAYKCCVSTDGATVVPTTYAA